MASQGGLASRNDGVAWQVDLPGLASLVMNLGAAGLKRFAQAGVDFHTVLCMGEIAEKCPASAEYRRQVALCRQEQRHQSRWLFKAIELGAATNFVADELLKTRAGENVVALMSTLLPIMPESLCDRVILKLFEESGASLEKTPGLNQLSSIKQTLAPLVNKIDFKDKVLQYHCFLQRLLQSQQDPLNENLHKSIPNESTTSKLIILLSRVIQDSKLVLEYDGFDGSSWLVVYAKYVLGLSVCVMQSDSTSVPISSDFQTARVLVNIYRSEKRCKLVSTGQAQDIIVPQSITVEDCNSWAVNVDNVNLVDMYIADEPLLRNALAFVARSLLEDYLRAIVKDMPQSNAASQHHFRKCQVRGYTEYCFESLLQRAQVILATLGFDVSSTECDLDRSSTDYVILDSGSATKSVYPKFNIFSATPGRAWLSEDIGSLEYVTSDTPITAPYPGRDGDLKFNRAARSYLRFTFRAVRAASWLALTNWEQNLRTISVGFLASKMPVDQDDSNVTPWGLCSLGRICDTILKIAIGERRGKRVDFDRFEVFAFQQRGVVICNAVAAKQAFDLNACFIDMIPGTMILHGEPVSRILSHADQYSNYSYDDPRDFSGPISGPLNLFDPIDLRTTLDIEEGDAVLHQSAVFESQVWHLMTPGGIFQSLIDCCIPVPCVHGYEVEPHKTNPLRHAVGLQLRRNHDISPSGLALQAVDRNVVGQYLAYQSSGMRRSFSLLQRNCCLNCAYDVLSSMRNLIAPIYSGGQRIICARLPEEDMNGGV